MNGLPGKWSKNPEGEIITLRDITTVDPATSELVREWRNSDEVKRYMCTDHEITKAEHLNWLKSLKGDDARKTWVAYLGGKPVGVVQLTCIDRINKNAEWGVYIGNPGMRGEGIGSRLVTGLMRHVFEDMNIDRMRTKVLGNNDNAINLYKKIGFLQEDGMREQLCRKGENIDIIVMSILKDDWAKKQEARPTDEINFE